MIDNSKNMIIVVDFETTGTFDESKFPVPIEIGLVKIKNNEIVDTYESLIHTDEKISEFIEKYTGISNAMIECCTNTLQDVLTDVTKFCNGKNAILAAWPISYEIPILQTIYNQCGYKEFPLSRRAIDIGTLFYYSEFYHSSMVAPSLDVATKAMGISHNGTRHRALPDAIIEANVLIKLIDRIKNAKQINISL